jgi:hypothetical protein
MNLNQKETKIKNKKEIYIKSPIIESLDPELVSLFVVMI